MPSTIKHRADGTFYEQGDTQGLLIQSLTDALSMKPANIGSVAAGNTGICKPGTIIYNYNFSIDTDGYIAVKKGEVFAIKYPVIGMGGNSDLNLTVRFFDTARTAQSNSVQRVIYNSGMFLPSINVIIPIDGFIQIGITPVSAVTSITFTDTEYLQIARVGTLSPYIIANKGALVSGGAFRFDIDGNAFTENYNSGETRIGTWLNGKPIYRSCLLAPVTMSISGNWADTTIPVPANLELLIGANVVSTVSDKYYEEDLHFNVEGTTIRIFSQAGLTITTNKSYIILKYTKTTD
jgi:hypothetical protein